MSGGSYNYLYCKEVDQLMQGDGRNELDNMRDRLIELGYEDVAKDIETFIVILNNARTRLETRIEMLSDIFRAVEWLDSGDSGKEEVKDAIEKYRNL